MASVLRRQAARLRRLPWNRFFAGVVAGAAALVVTLIMRILGLGVFLPELAFDFVITKIPGSLESFFITSLGEGAKGLGLVSALVAIEFVFGLGAVPFRRVQSMARRRIAVIAMYTVVGTALITLVVLPVLGVGFGGVGTDAGAPFAILSQLIGSWLYAAVLDYFLVDVAERHPEGFSPSRRQFFIGAAAGVASLAFAFEMFSSAVVQPARLAFASVADLLAKEVTPTEDFYVVTKNLIDPPYSSTWNLTVDGLVASALALDNASLQTKMQSGELPPVQEYATMECVSNEVGGNLIGTAKWSGVRLADVLNLAGIESTADWVEFSCSDGYTVAIPRAKAMDVATLLVLDMNDVPLEGRHGGPVRILVPGKYGMFSAKWVTRITAIQGEYLGYWQQPGKGWTNDGPIETEALIAIPADGAVSSGPTTIGGFAVSAADGISKVEVSTDGGSTWTAAQLRTPKDPKLTWVLWTFAWTPMSGGAYRIVARAYDGNGVVQTATVAPPYPNGASGYDQITLYVSV